MKNPKVREDLNLFFPSGATLVIKVLKDLENRLHTFFYRHVGPEGPKEMMREKTVRAAARRPSLAGDRPPHYAPPNIPPFTVVRGPVPRMRWRRKNGSSGP